jgi:hypothetical protein
MAAIEDLDALNRGINTRAAALADASVEIVEQWDRLAQIGAQREDHAAALLANLLPHLEAMRRYVSTCIEQIKTFQANPFS